MTSPSHDATTRRRVALALLTGVGAISLAAIFFRETAPTHPLVAAGLRLVLASLLLLPALGRAIARGTVTRQVLRAGLAAGAFYAVHFGAWVSSLHLTSVAAATTLVTATPLLLGLVALITGRDRAPRALWLALGLATAGVVVIASGHSAESPDAVAGDALALLGAGAMAGYLLVARSLGAALPVWAFTAIATGTGGLLLTGAALGSGIPLVPASPRAAAFIVAAVLLPQLVGHTALTWALRHATPTRVGLATVGEPALSTLWAWLWLGEAVGLQVAAGCALTLGAVLLALRPAVRPAAPAPG